MLITNIVCFHLWKTGGKTAELVLNTPVIPYADNQHSLLSIFLNLKPLENGDKNAEMELNTLTIPDADNQHSLLSIF